MSDEREPLPPGWWKLVLLGWLVHATLLAGMYVRVVVAGDYYVRLYREWGLALPAMTRLVLSVADARGEQSLSLVVYLGLVLFDGAMLFGLAVTGRSAWKWWFWFVTILLILLGAFVEYVMYLPAWKLREALSR